MLRRESDKNEALVNYQDITFGKLLGSGGFGEVYHGNWRHNDVAVKKLLLKDITPESAAEFETESQIMARLRSPNIVQFYGYAIEPERCIVMEYCPNGSLRDVLRSQQPLEWTVRIKIALGAAKGLAFLHEEKILHRDIKSLNILLTEHFEAKLTDFGLSKLKTESKSESSVHNKSGKEAVGTVQWVAPELFNRRGVFTQKSDIYSLGITFWELASRQIPFASAPSREVIRTGTCLKTLAGHADFVRCLQPLPSGELVSSSDDSTLKVWDLRTGTCLKTLAGHVRLVSCLQLLPSGELVSGSGDKTLKVWDLTEFSLAPVIEEKKAYRPMK